MTSNVFISVISCELIFVSSEKVMFFNKTENPGSLLTGCAETTFLIRAIVAVVVVITDELHGNTLG
jgi:hypothetical protein